MKLDYNLPALQHFSTNALILLERISELKRYRPGEAIVQENTQADALYLVLEGSLEVRKCDFKGIHRFIASIHPGEFVGELSFIEGGAYSATVIAHGEASCLKINFKDLKDERNKPLYIDLIEPIYRKLSGRLRNTTHSMVRKLNEQLELGTTSSVIIIIITIYNLMIGFLNQQHVLSKNTLYTTVVLLLILVGVTFIVLKRSIYPITTFGLDFKSWRQDIWLGICYSVPLLIVSLLFKCFLIYWLQPINATVFSFKSSFLYHLSWGEYFYNMVIYSIFCVSQEFIARSGIQASFYHFLLGTQTQRAWISIILSALLFGSIHMHVSVGAALTAVPLGIYWGYIFYRTNSLICASVSHIVVGDIGLFVIGYYHLF